MRGGTVLTGLDRPLQLLVDLKSAAGPTYAALDRVLRRHPRLLTSWDAAGEHAGAVTVVVSGNRDLPAMQAQAQRYAAHDGRLPDLDSSHPATLVPLVSASWSDVSSWRGLTPAPAATREKVADIVARAHAAGRRVRFWATPDERGRARERVWRLLLDAGVDHLNTDDLAGLERFLSRR
jgi:glycerophosphoryl diester phosphodiesterase